MPEVRALECPELKEIYKTHMREDFPLMELRPWFAIEKVWERGGYSAYGYYEGEQFLAYAAFYASTELPCVLLDYYAVVPELRGRGIGSAFLRDLLDALPPEERIFIEAESASTAKDEEDRATREARIAFYQNGGALDTGVNCQLFGVDYNILYFPGSGGIMAPDESYDVVCALYKEFYRPVYGKICKPYQK